jgi:SEC-C motif
LLSGLGNHKWRLLLAVALYLAFLPLWWYSLGLIAIASGPLANLIYGFFDPRVSIYSDGRVLGFLVTVEGAQPHASGLRLDLVTYGMPMLAALIIATRADTLLLKVRALVVGLALMAALVVPAAMAWAKLTSLEIDDQISPGSGRAGFLFLAFHGFAFSQPVVATGVWLGMLMLGTFKQKQKPESLTTSVGRNAPCPCGSGRKYKRCCGRAKNRN